MIYYEQVIYMTIGERIKKRRKEIGLTVDDLANLIGKNRATIYRYESDDIENLPVTVLEPLASALRISPAELFGWDSETGKKYDDVLSIPGIMPIPKTVKRPRLGAIACGEPILAEENFDGYDDVPDGIPCDFTLICEGDSMINARIHDGDIVYIKQQPTVENGQIAAIMIDGETTLKRVYIDGDRLTTIPENPAYKPHTYIGEELNNIRIIGLATGFTSILT